METSDMTPEQIGDLFKLLGPKRFSEVMSTSGSAAPPREVASRLIDMADALTDPEKPAPAPPEEEASVCTSCGSPVTKMHHLLLTRPACLKRIRPSGLASSDLPEIVDWLRSTTAPAAEHGYDLNLILRIKGEALMAVVTARQITAGGSN